MTNLSLHVPPTDLAAGELQRAAELGVPAVEVRVPPSGDDAEQLAGALFGAGLRALLVSAAGDGERWALGETTDVEDGRRRIAGALALAERVGARKVRVPVDATAAARHDVLVALREAADAASARGAAVVVDFGDSAGPATVEDLLELIARVGSPSVLCNLDLARSLRDGRDPVADVTRAAARIGHAQLLGDRYAQPDAALAERVAEALATAGYADALGVDAALYGALAGRGSFGRGADEERLGRLRRAMEEAGLDALACTIPENVVALSGYWSMNGTCLAIVPREGDPCLLVPRGEEPWAAASGWHDVLAYPAGRLADPPAHEAIGRLLRNRLGELGLAHGRVGSDEELEAFVPPHMAHEAAAGVSTARAIVEAVAPGAQVVAARELLMRERAVKTARELAALRRTATIADRGLEAFRTGIAAGRTDVDLATEVEREIERFGVGSGLAGRVRAYAYVMSGPQLSQAFLPFEVSTRRAMSDGELVLLELAVVADGYWHDLSRTHAVGTPTERQAEVFGHVEGAWQAAAAAARAGATAGDVDRAARGVLEEAGLGAAFVHGSGHGTGIAFHEPYPLLRPDDPTELREGMVLAIEPGVYLPGFGGMRNEDDCLVTATGAESLVTAPHALDRDA